VQAIYHQALAAIRLRLQHPLGIGAPIPPIWTVRKPAEATVTRSLYRELKSKMSFCRETMYPLTYFSATHCRRFRIHSDLPVRIVPPMSCDRATIPLFTITGPPSMTLIAQAFRLVSSWKFATSTVFQKLSAPRNPTDPGPEASILTPISPTTGLLKAVCLAHGELALVQLDCGLSVPPA
jgi:hypothetical protein